MGGCVAILGVYSKATVQKAGRGQATSTDFVQKLLWFALRLDEERCLIQALNDKGLPGGPQTPVSGAELARDYVPEPAAYRDLLFPVLVSLRDKLEVLGGPQSLNMLSAEEAQILKSLSVGRLLEGQADEIQVARLLLAGAPAADGDFAEKVVADLSQEAVTLRKQRDFGRAIAWFLKGLEIAPGDDHLLFNLARAYYENQETEKCRQCLERALSINPEFREARRFLDFLSGAPSPAKSGGPS